MSKYVITILIFFCVIIGELCWILWREKRLDRQIKKEQEELEKQYKKEQEERDEQNRENTKAKESMETGSGAADFAASINILSKLKS